ncbi:hypothetical protein BASA62_000021 [Batrachochytrium salamandrivorans]|nr:hypothetical protein BASA62_000021 [Batrachochytrium salamandrivorans]
MVCQTSQATRAFDYSLVARLSTAIGPLLVETGTGSLLTRSLVSRNPLERILKWILESHSEKVMCQYISSESTGTDPEMDPGIT